MTSIPMTDILTIVFTLVDDWCQENIAQQRAHKRGRKPKFTDSEVITLALVQDFISYPGETQFLAFIRANYLDMFPDLLDQSQFNRRARSLCMSIEALRRSWLAQKGLLEHSCHIIDTKPVPVVGYKRNKKSSEFLGSAAYGYCVSRNMRYFGYKLVTISTLGGFPIAYDLVPANTADVFAAEEIIDYFAGCDILADKGFIGFEWQTSIFDQTGNLIWTPKRANQLVQTKNFDRWLNSTRERIEGVFHELQNTGRNIERLLAKTIVGLCTRIAAKLTSHLLRLILRLDFGIDIQTFSAPSSF